MTDRIRYCLSLLGFLLMITCLVLKYRLDASAQEAHTWLLWTEQLGDWHKVSKIQIEERCYIIIEGWTKTHDSLVMHVEQTPCPARHP